MVFTHFPIAPLIKTKCEESCENMKQRINWENKKDVLDKINNYIINNNFDLSKSAYCGKWGHILTMCKRYNYNINELCEELGYDYMKLKKRERPFHYYSNYDNLKDSLISFIDTYGYFPTLVEMSSNLGISGTTIRNFGGVKKIKDSIGYIGNDLIDDFGFRNRSHYEYIVAQFLIHNNISYKREQHPFPKPYNNLRSDFTFKTENEQLYHVEVWGYKKENSNGFLSQSYCKKKSEKIHLYKRYNINLISIENNIFSYSYEVMQKKLCEIFSEILNKKLEIINHKYLIHPNSMTDKELFNKIIQLSDDPMVLPSKKDFTNENKILLYEALKRFNNNYNNFAKHFDVTTKRKQNYWNAETVLNKMLLIKQKYGYMPNTTEIYDNVKNKNDSMFFGLIDGIKSVYGNISKGYVAFYEKCKKDNINIDEKEIEHLQKMYKNKNKNRLSNIDKQRIYDILYT